MSMYPPKIYSKRQNKIGDCIIVNYKKKVYEVMFKGNGFPQIVRFSDAIYLPFVNQLDKNNTPLYLFDICDYDYELDEEWFRDRFYIDQNKNKLYVMCWMEPIHDDLLHENFNQENIKKVGNFLTEPDIFKSFEPKKLYNKC